MTKPVLVIAHRDRETLAVPERDRGRRFGADYLVVAVGGDVDRATDQDRDPQHVSVAHSGP